MSDDARPRIDADKVTWRAIVLVALTIIGFLSGRVLSQLDKTAELAVTLQSMVVALNSRIDAHKDRLADHDKAIYRLEDRVFVRASP